jgi:hypothetical protein
VLSGLTGTLAATEGADVARIIGGITTDVGVLNFGRIVTISRW